MTRKLSTDGFALTLVIGVLLVVAALGLGGFFVWQHSKKDDKSSQTTSKSQGSQSKSDGSTSQTTDPTDSGKYLYIKEWGVRFALPEDLRGDIITNVSDVTNSGTVLFASNKLNTATGDDSCAFIKQSWGYTGGLEAQLNRLNPKTYPADSLTAYKSQLTYVKTVGDYEYYYAKSTKNPPITCTTENHPDLNDTETHISDELKAAFKSIEAVKN